MSSNNWQAMTDAGLLEAYTTRQDDAAFGELMRRHGALVYRACRRLLKDAHEAEDAAQAVFVVLARQAGGLRRGNLAAWLYRVAHNVAAEIVRKRMHRTTREQAYAESEARLGGETTAADAASPAVLEVLDRALLTLPERYREAVILRYLQNHSQEAAARLAGCPLGTLSRRASEGLSRLRRKLGELGVATSVTALTGVLTTEASAPVPATLFASILATVKTVAGTATAAGSAKALALAKGVLKTLFWAKVKTAAAAVVLTAGIVVGGGVVARKVLTPRVAGPAPAPPATLWVWGGNADGQGGAQPTTARVGPAPVRLADGSAFAGVQAVAAGISHTVALRRDQTVWDWGRTGSRGTPEQVRLADGTPLAPVTAVAVSRDFAVALKADGRVWAWGGNDRGQLGDGTTTARPSPVPTIRADGTPLAGVSAIAAGRGFAVALKADRTVWTWGYNGYGQLGDGTTTERHFPVPVKLADGTPLGDVVAITAGCDHTVALKTDRTVWAWGSNVEGRVGDNTVETHRVAPVQVKLPGAVARAGIKAIAAQWNHTVALTSDGLVVAWGANSRGQLGDGTTTNSYVPVPVTLPDGTPLGGIAALAAGVHYTVALTNAGRVWAWGCNDAGQLGDGTRTNRLRPVAAQTPAGQPLAGVTAIAAGFDHTVALIGNHQQGDAP